MFTMLNFIKQIKFRWSDLALLVGAAIFVLFVVEGQLFMFHQDPSEVNFPPVAAIILFIVGLIAFGIYIYLEYQRGNNPPIYVSVVAGVIILTGLIGIIIEPALSSFNVPVLGEVTIAVNWFNKCVFIFELILIVLFIYATFFMFSKRFNSYLPLLVLCYIVFLFAFVVSLYSYIVEYSQMSNYLQVLFGYKEGSLTSTVSFLINPNAVGMAMLVAIIMALIAHAIKPRWWYYLLAVFFFINLFFTYCRGSIFFAAISILAYLIYRLVVTFKTHKTRNIILIVVLSSIVITLALLFGVTLGYKGYILPHLFSALNAFTNPSSMSSRADLYKLSFMLLKDGYWAIGRGFGVFNLLLTNVNPDKANYVTPAHNGFIAVLGEGGIIFALMYLAITAYSVFVIIKSFKKSPHIIFAVILGITSFFFYSLFETIQYLMYFYIFILLMVANINKVNIYPFNK